MRLYIQIHRGTLGNIAGYARDILKPCQPCTPKTRHSSNINVHINEKAGFRFDSRDLCDKSGIIEKQVNGRTRFIRMKNTN